MDPLDLSLYCILFSTRKMYLDFVTGKDNGVIT